ncbi:MAG: hypothetical protein ACRC6I_13795 [Paracoccaceae bacterium]
MRALLGWLLFAAVVKSAALYGFAVQSLGGSTDYLMVVGTMLTAMGVNAVLVGSYAALKRPRRWGLIACLLIGLTASDYIVAELIIRAFEIQA